MQVSRNCWWYISFTRTRITGPGTVLLMVAAGVHCAAQQQTEAPRQGSAPNNKGVAFRSAQLGLLRALRAQQISIHTSSSDVVLPDDPVFWASFVLQGAP